MTPPVQDKYTDLPPRIAENFRAHNRQIVKLVVALCALGTGLVTLAGFCLQHHHF